MMNFIQVFEKKHLIIFALSVSPPKKCVLILTLNCI